ncbi:MAG: TetR family transcriptional regulator [Gordonia sp. (in: high G+C Gram-positive bacteria)]
MVPKAATRRTRKVRNTATPEDQYAAILAAATTEFTDVGIRRANIDEVARRAGVSRSTLYRRFPNKQALLMAVAEQHYEVGMRRLAAAARGLDPQGAVVAALVEGAAMLSSEPLLRYLVLANDEMKQITGAVTTLFIDLATERVAQTLREAGAAMPRQDLFEAVEIHVRLVISFLETPPSDPERAAPDRVGAWAAKFLAPMIW